MTDSDTDRTVSNPSVRPFAEYRDTPLWRALTTMLADLEASREVAVATAPEYVVGYLCRELAAKNVLSATALDRELTR
jgi:hypothetical protein